MFTIPNRQMRVKALEFSKVSTTSIAPKETVSYTKETQTITTQVESEGLYFNYLLNIYKRNTNYYYPS